MKMSRRAQRMERHHKKHKHAVSLNLVSLMDIFTILVFFLLVSSSEVEILPTTRSLTLPESVASQKPRETMTIMVTAEAISVGDRRIAAVNDVLASEERSIPALREFLKQSAISGLAATSDLLPEVTIMADKTITYKLLKKIMLSCSQARFGQVSFAVLQQLSDSPS